MQQAHTEQARAYAGASSCGFDPQPRHATRELLRLLSMVPPQSGTEYVPESPELHARLAGNCEACLRTIHLGVAALGQLVARCSLDLQDGTIHRESIENLGFLMAELGDLASECMRIAAASRTDGNTRAERACAA